MSSYPKHENNIKSLIEMGFKDQLALSDDPFDSFNNDDLVDAVETLIAKVKELEQKLWHNDYSEASRHGASSLEAREYANKMKRGEL